MFFIYLSTCSHGSHWKKSLYSIHCGFHGMNEHELIGFSIVMWHFAQSTTVVRSNHQTQIAEPFSICSVGIVIITYNCNEYIFLYVYAGKILVQKVIYIITRQEGQSSLQIRVHFRVFRYISIVGITHARNKVGLCCPSCKPNEIQIA